MIDWIATDPLSGIGTTIGFFMSAISGHYLRIYKERRQDLKLRKKVMQERYDTRIKIIITFILIFSISSLGHWYLAASVLASCIVAAYYLNTGLKQYLSGLFYPNVIAIFILITQALTYGNTVILGEGIFSVYKEGIFSGFLIYVRVMAAVAVLNLFTTTTGMPEIIGSLKWFRMPGIMIDLTALMHRYIGLFKKESIKIHRAQVSRCGFLKETCYKNKINNFGTQAGLLFIRALKRSEQTYNAMVSRGYRPNSVMFVNSGKIKFRDMFFGFMVITGTGILLIMDRIL